MVSTDTFQQMALSFPASTEQPHFEKTSFRVSKKIFATLDIKNKLVSIKLSAADQDVFSAFDKTIIYPVPNKWGKQGWTIINLQKIRKAMCMDALTCAYLQVTPKKNASLLPSPQKNK
ncbi:MAG: MmcQ/YjbR family DNA-binding protein [Chitinophagaceae bacterium]